MKRVLALVLALILCLSMFAGCGKEDEAPTTAPTEATTAKPQENSENEVTEADLKDALAYVKTIYKKVSETTPSDFKRIASVPIKKIQHPVVWTVNVSEDLVKVLPAENGQVTIDVNEKSTEEVPYELTATISNDKGVSVSHTWKHILPAAASLEDMQEIVKAAYALEKGQSMGYAVTLQGVITMINTPWDPSYQNISVTFVVEGCEDMPIQAYRMKGDGCDQLKIGDTITVTGEIKNYNGTIEFDAGCTLDAYIKGEEVKAPEDPKQIVDEAYALGANQSLKYEATLTGTIITVSTPYDSAYGNITVIMEVEGRESKPIQCYRLKGDGVDKIGINDIITVKGYITNYVGSKGYSTIQYTAGCQLIAWEDRDTPEQPSDPKQVVDEAYALGANKSLKYEATLTGRITKVKTAYDASFGNISVEFVVEGRESKPILAYRMKGTGVDKLGIGDVITVKGFITNYVGDAGYSTIEYTAGCQLLKYVKNTAVAPTDSLTIVKEAYALAAGKQLPYEATVTGKITKVNTAYDASYKNVTVTIVVEGGENMPIKCYRLKGTGADKIGVGDVITVKGYIENYQHSSGDTEVEFTAGCQLVKWVDDGTTTPDTPVNPNVEVPVMVTDPKVGQAYKMFMNKTSDGKVLYFNGQTESSSVTYRLATTENGAEAVDVYLEAATGGYRLYFMNGNTKTYIRIFERSPEEKKGSLELVTTAPAEVLTYNKTYNTLVYTATTGQSYYIGTYSTYVTYSVSNLSYMSGDNLDVSQFPAHLTLNATAAPEQPEPEDPKPEQPTNGLTFVEAPEAGKAYKFGMQQNGLATPALLMLTGEMSGFYYETTEDKTAAVDVYLEAANGGYYLYYMNGNTKTYLDIVQRDGYEDKVNVVFQTSGTHTVYKLNTEYKYLYANVLDIDWYLGTYGTNKSISASKTSYISDTTTIGVSQFCAWFLEGDASGSTTPDTPVVPDEPVIGSPEIVTAPAADTAYKLYMYKNNEGKQLFFNGLTESETVTYRLATTENAAEAVDVFVEEEAGYFVLYFMNGGVKTYIRVYERTPGDAGAGKGSLEFTTEKPVEFMEFNSELNTFILTSEDGENAYYMGTYSTYTTFSVSNTSYITGSNAANVDVSQFPARLVTLTGTGTTPTPTPTPTPDPEPSDPVTPPPADTTGEYRNIGKAEDLTEGTYLIAVYAESYNDTSFAANPWHFWDGNITTGTNYDMVTNTYAFENGSLTKYSNSSVGAAKNGDAVEIQLIKVEGKENTYYIKFGDQYITATYEKRKISLSADPAEWIAENHKDGGIVMHHYVGSGFVTMGFAGAATNMIRSYKDSSGAMNTGIKGGLYFFAEN